MMDFVSDANNKPGCSKLVCKDPSSIHKEKTTDNLIVIDDYDSCDSAYETGSSLSRSSLSSPTGKQIQCTQIVQISLEQNKTKCVYQCVRLKTKPNRI